MAGYVHFTDEQKQRANSVDLVDFLRRQGEQLIRSGREWRWKRHDSVTIRGNRWFRHSAGQGGLAIDFVQEFYGLSFPDAMLKGNKIIYTLKISYKIVVDSINKAKAPRTSLKTCDVSGCYFFRKSPVAFNGASSL